VDQVLATSVEEYLETTFEDGDREFIDGEIQEINVGELDHSAVQAAIAAFFFGKRKTIGLHCVTECRTRVSPTRFRLPDVAVVLGEKPRGRVLESPPFLVVEILSPEDRVSRMEDRIDDYLRFGVPWIWVIDPSTGRGHIYSNRTRIAVTGGIYRTSNPDIEMHFNELFD